MFQNLDEKALISKRKKDKCYKNNKWLFATVRKKIGPKAKNIKHKVDI